MNKVIAYMATLNILLFIGCGDVKKENTKNNIMKTDSITRPLENALNERKSNFEKSASTEKKTKYAEGLKSVAESNIVNNALQVGNTAINFTLKNASGKNITLYKELKKGPVILMWYRGGWCPYCNMTLHYMQESLSEFKKYGANLLALSPETPDNSITTKEKNELQFEVLSDINNEVAHQYKVLYKLTDDVAEIYENSFGLSKYNGNDQSELPLAVTYIIGKDKIIKYAFLDADYRNRAEPNDLIAFLKQN